MYDQKASTLTIEPGQWVILTSRQLAKVEAHGLYTSAFYLPALRDTVALHRSLIERVVNPDAPYCATEGDTIRIANTRGYIESAEILRDLSPDSVLIQLPSGEITEAARSLIVDYTPAVTIFEEIEEALSLWDWLVEVAS